jgi:glutathione S-transferase
VSVDYRSWRYKRVIADREHRFQGQSVPEDETSIALTTLAPKLDALDGIMSKQKYMAGDQFSLVDAFYMPLAHLLVSLGFGDLIFGRPYLKQWWETVIARKAWKEAVEPFNLVYGF